MGDPSTLSILQRKLHTCQVLLWLKQTYQVQDDGDFVLSKELVYQAYLAMMAAHEYLAELPQLTRPVLGKMVKRAFPSVPSIRRGPRGRVKQLYVGLVPQTRNSTQAIDGRAKRMKKTKKKLVEEDEEDEILLRPFSYESTDTAEVSANSPMRHRSDNEEGKDCDNDRDEELENGCITTTTTTTTDEEQTRRYSLETTTTTTSSTPPTPSSPLTRSGSYSSGDRASPRSSLESTTASPSSSSSSLSTTTTFFFASSSPSSYGAALGSPLHDTQPGPDGNAYQGPEAAWNGVASRGYRDFHHQPKPTAKVADMTNWARRAERLGRYRVTVAQTSGEAPPTDGRNSVVEWVELIISPDLKSS